MAGIVYHTMRVMNAGNGKPLSPTQRKVYTLVGQGMTNPEVAAALGMAENTVRNHMTRIFERTGMRRRADIIIQCHRDPGDEESAA